MESTHLLQSTTLLNCSTSMHRHRPIITPRNKRPSIVVAVLTQPADHHGISLSPPHIPTTSTSETTGRYNDNWFDRFAIHHLSQSVQAATGMRNDKSGFESLVEAATAVSRNYDPTKQQELVILALDKAFPRPFMSLIRALVPQCKFTRELFAAFTTLFFAWLVGPCEVRESEFHGRSENNVVHIKKCRFLEETNCVGMCTNLCKIPSQSFIKDSLGMPVNMVPNFEDMSCEMIFGEEPPALMDDPAFKQPCYKLCRASRKHHNNCSS